MSDLTRFRDHARAMSTAEHKPECDHLTAKPPPRWLSLIDDEGYIYAMALNPEALSWERPRCPGCITDTDRALWDRLANEADAYLDRNREETLL